MLVLGFVVPPQPRAVADRAVLLGFPWEADIVAGVAEQDRERRRNKSLDAIVREADRRSRRAGTVPNLYLLARAYGLRFSNEREQAEQASNPDERARLERAAEENLASALSVYADVVRLEPRCYFAFHDMAVLELRRANRRRRVAFEHLVQALRINDGYTDARRKLIRLYIEGGQHAEALPQLDALLRQEPDDTVARVEYIVCLVRMQRHAEAETQVRTLLARQPDNSLFLDLLAQIQVATGRYEEGIQTYRAVARANPSMVQPFVGVLRALEAMREKAPESAPRFDDYLFALRGLLRLETDPEQRSRLEADIRKLEADRLRPVVAEGREPTLEDVLAILDKAPGEEDRARAIHWVLLRKTAPEPDTMRRIARHIGPAVEPAPGIRAFAARALAEVGGTGAAPLVRLALLDADATVRQAALDALVVVGMRDRSASRALVAVMLPLVGDPDVGVSSAARSGVLQLLQHRLGLDAEADEKAHRAAFAAWIATPEAEELLARGLDEFGVLRDRFADGILATYLDHDTGIVAKAAYDAIGRFAGTLPADDPRAAWWASRPELDHEAFRQDEWPKQRATVAAWRNRRP